MRTLKDTGLLFQRHFTQQLRNPVWLFVGLSSPVLYLVLFTPLLKHFTRTGSTGAVLDIFFPGILALLAFASGTAQGFGTIFELRSGVIERLRVTPASRLAILAGPLVSAMTFMFFFDAIAVAVAYGFGFQIHWGGLLVLAVLIGIFMVMISAWSVAHGTHDQGDRRLCLRHEPPEPARPAPRRRALADLARSDVAAGGRPL